jgi:hypothetical protein
MSKIDINEYKEVAAHALNILQQIMNKPFGDPTAKAIAAAAVLNHCKSVIERERQQVSYAPAIGAEEMAKCIQNIVGGMPDNAGLARANSY